MNTYQLLIDGQLVDGAETLDVINPATGDVFQTAPRASEAQLHQALAAAKQAFPQWSRTSPEKRKEALLALASGIEARMDEFAQTLTNEQGRPLAQAKGEVYATVQTIRVVANMSLEPKVLRETEQSRVVEYLAPLGVVATITPWNFPLLLLIHKIAPALLAGNTVVAKPAPTTPLTTLMVGEVCAEVLPAGVFNTIVDHNDLGAILTSHPDVAKVSFTGSSETGKKVLASISSTLKRVTLELGGNDAALILDDVDVKDVAARIYNAGTYNAGQICVAVKRVYVPESLYDEFCDALVALAGQSVVGDGSDPKTQVGPVQNKMQFEKIRRLLDDTRSEGKIIAGGNVLDRPGYFVAPTVVRDVTDDARIVAEEQFAPILPVLKYTDVEDAIERINRSIYGLAGSVWSSDIGRAEQIAARIDSGTVWVNSHLALDPTIPFRGAKQSGIGVELGEEGLLEYTQRRIVNVAKPASA